MTFDQATLLKAATAALMALNGAQYVGLTRPATQSEEAIEVVQATCWQQLDQCYKRLHACEMRR